MEGKKRHSALQARARTLLNNICRFTQDCVDSDDTSALYWFSSMVEDILSDDGGVIHV